MIIDLDADIEKSSNVDSTQLMIPLQTLANSYSTSDNLDSPDKTNNKGEIIKNLGKNMELIKVI